jgi:hypothetical protein
MGKLPQRHMASCRSATWAPCAGVDLLQAGEGLQVGNPPVLENSKDEVLVVVVIRVEETMKTLLPQVRTAHRWGLMEVSCRDGRGGPFSPSCSAR